MIAEVGVDSVFAEATEWLSTTRTSVIITGYSVSNVLCEWLLVRQFTFHNDRTHSSILSSIRTWSLLAEPDLRALPRAGKKGSTVEMPPVR